MAQLLLKTSPKHRDLPVVAAASLGDTALVSARRWPCARPSPTGLPRSGPWAPSWMGRGPHGALTGAQASGLGRSSPSSGRQSRASKYSHWSRGRNFLERAWRPNPADQGGGWGGGRCTQAVKPPGPLSGAGHSLAPTVTSASLPAPSAWARTHLQHLLGGHCAQHGCHGAQDPSAAQGDCPHQRFVQRLLPRLSRALRPPRGLQGLGQAHHLLCVGLGGSAPWAQQPWPEPHSHSDPQAATTLFPRKGSRARGGGQTGPGARLCSLKRGCPALPMALGHSPSRGRGPQARLYLFIYVFVYLFILNIYMFLPWLVLLGG